MPRCLTVLSVVFIGLIQGNASQAEDGDMGTLRALAERCVQDIATIMEDVKMLLLQHDGHTGRAGQAPSPSQTTTFKPQSCQDTKNTGQSTNGLATIFLPHVPVYSPLTVYCDQTTSDGGWMLLLRRIDNAEDFPNRHWQAYKAGFGNPTLSSYWVGLEVMHQLTKHRHATLRVDLEDFEGATRFAEYSYFRIGSEETGYRLYVDGYTGTAGDSLTYHNGQRFSTRDKDQDIHSNNCAEVYNGAWWYKGCVVSCLTGEYIAGDHEDKAHQGVYWRHWRGPNYSYKRAEMKIRY